MSEDAARQIEQLERDHEDLRRDFDDLKQKFKPGSLFVRDLIHKLVFDGTLTLPAGQSFQPAEPFDVSEDLQLAAYALSAKTEEAGFAVTYYGTSVVVTGTFISIRRVHEAGPPPRLESFFDCYNGDVTPHNLIVKVWRILSLV